MLEVEQPVLQEILASLPVGIAHWALHRFATAATNVAYREAPIAIVWHFQLAESTDGAAARR